MYEKNCLPQYSPNEEDLKTKNSARHSSNFQFKLKDIAWLHCVSFQK